MSSRGVSVKKRNYLPLESKVAVIREAERVPRSNLRSLSRKYGCGKTQISNILKRKESILANYESDGLGGHARVSQYREVNEALHEWYVKVSEEGKIPTGIQIVEEAKAIAKRLGKTDFKGTNGWLSKWKKRYHLQKSRYNTKARSLAEQKEERHCNARDFGNEENGNSSLGSTAVDVIPPKIQKSPIELLVTYSKRNIYFLGQTSCLWKALPCLDFCTEVESMMSGEIVRLAFLVNTVGDKETIAIVWKHENPKCFQGSERKNLPVKYYYQKDGLLTNSILQEILNDFNSKLRREKRLAAVLLDPSLSSSCSQLCCSHLEICFLPETSKPSPLEWGVHIFKCQYRQFFLRNLIAKMNSQRSVGDIADDTTILMAIHWVALAWERVNSDVVLKSINRAGAFDDEGVARSRDEEPFEDTDEYVNLSWLISIAMGGSEHCSAEDYTSRDNFIPTDLDSEDHEDGDTVSRSSTSPISEEELESDQEHGDVDGSCQDRLETFLEAIQSLEKVAEFMNRNGMSSDMGKVAELVDQLAHQHIVSLTQAAMEISMKHEESS